MDGAYLFRVFVKINKDRECDHILNMEEQCEQKMIIIISVHLGRQVFARSQVFAK